MRSRRIAAITLVLITLAAVAAHARGADKRVRVGPGIVSLGPGQKARLIVFNAADPDAADQKAGSVNVTLKFVLFEPGQQVGPGAFRHAAAGEHSSGEVALAPGQGVSLDFTSDDDPDHPAVGAVRPGVSYSSLPGGSAAPLKFTLEIIDVHTGKTVLSLGGQDWE
jgi:hypothetical protein